MSEVSAQLRRILLPVDVSRDSLTALEIAFDLAAALGGEVSGIFIEDAELFAAGSLPFAREVGSLSGISRRISSSDIEHRFRAVASKARETLDEAGRRLKVPSSFRVARGDVSSEILTATTDADIVVIGKAGWSIGAVRKPGRTCMTILSQSRVPVLIAESGVQFSPPIMAFTDGSQAGRRAVEFAQHLAQELGWEISVFTIQDAATGDDVIERIRDDEPRLVILPSSLPFGESASQLKCAVLFVP